MRVLRYAAFTTDGAGGNPAGVVLDAGGLDAASRLALAAEIGYSETAFVDGSGADGRYHVQYFSPRAEVAFCGHATIATAVALAERHGPAALRFATQVGEVAVRTELGRNGLSATLTSVATTTRPVQARELGAALAALRWDESALDPRYPPHVAYAGAEHLVLAVAHPAVLARLDYDFAALEVLMAEQGWTTLHLVWAESAVRFHARDPFPPGGVVEDPATGAAAAAFGGYLRSLGLVELPARVTIVQGVDMGQPCLLLVDIRSDRPGIEVTGTALPL